MTKDLCVPADIGSHPRCYWRMKPRDGFSERTTFVHGRGRVWCEAGSVRRQPSVRQRWRFYATASGRKPAKDFIDSLSDADAAEVAAAMLDVRNNGLVVARHLRGELYEVRAEGVGASYRLLFAEEGAKGRILLALHAFNKKTRQTPPQAIDLAARRLAEWRRRSAL